MSIATTTSSMLDLVAVTATLKQVAARNTSRTVLPPVDPQYPSYPMHTPYLHAGKPNCLAACVLSMLGISDDVLQDLDSEFPLGEILRPGVRLVESRHPELERLDAKALALLIYVQRLQRKGVPWGAIVSQAFTVKPFMLARIDRERRPWLY